jgi:hypothetical protein
MAEILQKSDIMNIIISYSNQGNIIQNKNITTERYYLCLLAKINYLMVNNYNEQYAYYNQVIYFIRSHFDDVEVSYFGSPLIYKKPGFAKINIPGFSNGIISIRTDLYCNTICKCTNAISRRYCQPNHIEIMGGIYDEFVSESDDEVRTYEHMYYLVQAIRNSNGWKNYHRVNAI